MRGVTPVALARAWNTSAAALRASMNWRSAHRHALRRDPGRVDGGSVFEGVLDLCPGLLDVALDLVSAAFGL
jgi:hypothetical protein